MQHLYRCHLTYTDAFPDNIGGFLPSLYDEALRNMQSPVIMTPPEVCEKYNEVSMPFIKIIYNFIWIPRTCVTVCGTSCV